MQIVIEIDEERYKKFIMSDDSSPFMKSAIKGVLMRGKKLPEHHGRLIDGDALRRSFQESIESCHKWAEKASDADDDYMYARISQSLGTFVEASLRTKAQPTIIEATESEVNEHENSD